MAISTFAELQTAVSNWSDGVIPTAIIPDLIALAEARFNRTLFLPQSETTATATAAQALSFPTDFRQLRAIYLDTFPRAQLEQVSPSTLRASYDTEQTGIPRVFAIQDDQIFLGPSPDDTSVNVEIVYYAKIPALSVSNTTNWLLTDAPDVYLYATLLQGKAYVRDDDAIALWKAALDEALSELIAAGKRRQYSGVQMRVQPYYPRRGIG